MNGHTAPPWKESIESALSTAAMLSYCIRKDVRNEEFFRGVHRLGEKLLALRMAIEIARM